MKLIISFCSLFIALAAAGVIRERKIVDGKDAIKVARNKFGSREEFVQKCKVPKLSKTDKGEGCKGCSGGRYTVTFKEGFRGAVSTINYYSKCQKVANEEGRLTEETYEENIEGVSLAMNTLGFIYKDGGTSEKQKVLIEQAFKDLYLVLGHMYAAKKNK